MTHKRVRCYLAHCVADYSDNRDCSSILRCSVRWHCKGVNLQLLNREETRSSLEAGLLRPVNRWDVHFSLADHVVIRRDSLRILSE